MPSFQTSSGVCHQQFAEVTVKDQLIRVETTLSSGDKLFSSKRAIQAEATRRWRIRQSSISTPWDEWRQWNEHYWQGIFCSITGESFKVGVSWQASYQKFGNFIPSGCLSLTAWTNDWRSNAVGKAEMWEQEDGIYSAWATHVESNYRRKGICTALYDAAEKAGFRIRASQASDYGGNMGRGLSDDGAAFWKSRIIKRSGTSP